MTEQSDPQAGEQWRIDGLRIMEGSRIICTTAGYTDLDNATRRQIVSDHNDLAAERQRAERLLHALEQTPKRDCNGIHRGYISGGLYPSGNTQQCHDCGQSIGMKWELLDVTNPDFASYKTKRQVEYETRAEALEAALAAAEQRETRREQEYAKANGLLAGEIAAALRAKAALADELLDGRVMDWYEEGEDGCLCMYCGNGGLVSTAIVHASDCPKARYDALTPAEEATEPAEERPG